MMKPYLLSPLLLLAATATAQTPVPETMTAAISPSLLSQPPAVSAGPMYYEERLAKFEGSITRKLPTMKVKAEYWVSPWLVYFETYDKTRANAGTVQVDSTQMKTPGQANIALDVAWAGAMQASWNVNPGSAAARNWTYAAGALLLLDIFTSSADAKNAEALAAMEKGRKLTLNTPSLHFVKRVPGAVEQNNGYDVIREADLVVVNFGLQCEPALLHAPKPSIDYIGGPTPKRSYFRKYACGFGTDEKLTDKMAPDEVKLMEVMGYSDAPAFLKLSLSNLPAMSRMRDVLGVTAENEKNMGRLAYERVRDHLPADWTAVFTAPNEQGKWTVYVARNGVIDAFDAPDKL